MLTRVLRWVGALLTIVFAAWLVVDVVINGINLTRLPTIAGAVGVLAGLLLMWAAVAGGRKDSSSDRRSSFRGRNSGIYSSGDNAINVQQGRDHK